jgi:subfamily B ATP-binding cassette protein MsbA
MPLSVPPENPAPPRSKSGPAHFFRFLHYVKPYWKYILLAVIGGVVKFTIPLMMPQITRHLIDNVFLSEILPPEEKRRELWLWVGVMIGVFVFFFGPWVYVRHWFAPKAGQAAVFDLRCVLYRRILRMSASFFDHNKSGSILSRLTSDVQLAQDLVGNALTNVWMDATAVVVVLVFLIRIDPMTTLVALVTMPVYVVLFRKFGVEIKTSTRMVQEELASMSGALQEKLSGSSVVHAFAQEENEDRRFSDTSDRLFSMNMRRVKWQSLNNCSTAVLTAVAPLIVMLYAGSRVIDGDMSVGELIAVTMYLAPLYLPLQRFSELNVVFANSMAALERIFEFMDEEPKVQDLPGAAGPERLEGRVEFRDVYFSYAQVSKRVLRGVSCVVEPGMNIALVGPSGSGKSTFASLIPRFYDVGQGAILIDGKDIREYEVRKLRRHIGIVLQDPILFSGSIRENILYGRPEATDEDVLEACRAANAVDFIEKLPQGLDTQVGERGVLLSGGQKQRLTIARAFLVNPRILILDEATSSLDSESERLIQEALDRLIQGRTTFTIAHRLSTIMHADQILVISDGLIVERGTHAQLLSEGPVYSRLYQQQFHQSRLPRHRDEAGDPVVK